MTANPKRADNPAVPEDEPLVLTSADYAPSPAEEDHWLQPATSPVVADKAAGGRRVLGVVLSLLAILWVGYSS